MNAGKDMKLKAAPYSNDIYSPGTQGLAMANGRQKLLKELNPGLPSTPPPSATKMQVKELVTHKAKNYAITSFFNPEFGKWLSARTRIIISVNRALKFYYPIFTGFHQKNISVIRREYYFRYAPLFYPALFPGKYLNWGVGFAAH